MAKVVTVETRSEEKERLEDLAVFIGIVVCTGIAIYLLWPAAGAAGGAAAGGAAAGGAAAGGAAATGAGTGIYVSYALYAVCGVIGVVGIVRVATRGPGKVLRSVVDSLRGVSTSQGDSDPGQGDSDPGQGNSDTGPLPDVDIKFLDDLETELELLVQQVKAGDKGAATKWLKKKQEYAEALTEAVKRADKAKYNVHLRKLRQDALEESENTKNNVVLVALRSAYAKFSSKSLKLGLGLTVIPLDLGQKASYYAQQHIVKEIQKFKKELKGRKEELEKQMKARNVDFSFLDLGAAKDIVEHRGAVGLSENSKKWIMLKLHKDYLVTKLKMGRKLKLVTDVQKHEKILEELSRFQDELPENITEDKLTNFLEAIQDGTDLLIELLGVVETDGKNYSKKFREAEVATKVQHKLREAEDVRGRNDGE